MFNLILSNIQWSLREARKLYQIPILLILNFIGYLQNLKIKKKEEKLKTLSRWSESEWVEYENNTYTTEGSNRIETTSDNLK